MDALQAGVASSCPVKLLECDFCRTVAGVDMTAPAPGMNELSDTESSDLNACLPGVVLPSRLAAEVDASCALSGSVCERSTGSSSKVGTRILAACSKKVVQN